MYLVHTIPDICFAMSALSQFMYEPRHIHWVAVKHVLRYLCGTVGHENKYSSGGGVVLLRCTNSDWARSVVVRKSTSKYCFIMGSTMISWSSWRHSTMELSTTGRLYSNVQCLSRIDVASEAPCGLVW